MQGLTEFLPVSSSGHLTLVGHLFGLTEPQLVFDVVVHGATLVAVVVFYRRELRTMAVESVHVLPTVGTAAGRRGMSERFPAAWLTLMVGVGSVPTGIIGVVFQAQLESLFASPRAVAVALLVTAAVLLASRWAPAAKGQGVTVGRALLIGLVQGIAIVPGISRSGSTIVAAMFCGVERELAVRFSFLLSLPAILGAVLLHARHPGGVGSSALGPLTVGAAAALLSGLVALALVIPLVKRGRLHWFALYLGPAAALSLVWL